MFIFLFFQFSTDSVVPVFKFASRFHEKTALTDLQGDYTYRGLFLSSRQFSNELTRLLEGKQHERIALLLPNNATYVIAQWACWMCGQTGGINKVTHSYNSQSFKYSIVSCA